MVIGNHRLLVLGYHNITASWIEPFEDGASSFERQLRAVRATSNVIPLRAAVDDLTSGRRLPTRAVALSFDDGYRDNLEIAAPILEQLGLPATFFLTTDLLASNLRPWWEVLGHAWSSTQAAAIEWQDNQLATKGNAGLAALAQVCDQLKLESRAARDTAVAGLVEQLDPPTPADTGGLFLDWDEARELARRGFEIGSHTSSHPILSRETTEEQERQLADSRSQLEHELDTDITLLAYPNGRRIDYDDRTLEAAAAAGYTHAFTSVFGWNDSRTPAYELRRVIVEPTDGLRGLAMPFRYAVTDGIRSSLGRQREGGI